MTDAFTDELFILPEATTTCFPISRLLVDVERFPYDTEEPMSKVGMGVIYTDTAFGNELKRALQPNERNNLISHYETHHQALLAKVEKELKEHGKALIVDCHSFPNQPLPCDNDQSKPRPEFCVGTDPYHTPFALLQLTVETIKDMGFSVGINRPYAGSIVPTALYRNDSRVMTIMIEVNRSLYMDELKGEKTRRFDQTKKQIKRVLELIRQLEQQPSRAL